MRGNLFRKLKHYRSLSKIRLIYCGCAGFGQIFRSISLHSQTILLKRSKYLTRTSTASRRSLISDRLLGSPAFVRRGGGRALVAEDFGSSRVMLDFSISSSPRLLPRNFPSHLRIAMISHHSPFLQRNGSVCAHSKFLRAKSHAFWVRQRRWRQF